MIATNSKIAIIGAGTTGVYLASLLAQQGLEVSLFEKAPAPRTDGCGILLIGSGMKALNAGNPEICPKLIKLGSPAFNFEFRNLKGITTRSETVTYEADELPGMLIHRGAILTTLLETLPPHVLHCQKQLISLESSPKKVIAYFQDGSQWEGDLLIGADGIFSKVRQWVVPGVEVHYLGDIVWRGVVEDDEFCTGGNFIVYMRGRGIYGNFFDLGGGYTHWGFFLEAEQPEAEKGLPRPSNQAIPPQALAKLPEAARRVIAATPTERIITNYSYDLDPLPKFYQQRVLLMGDAAHAKSPTRARGMTSGFEDALCLAAYLNSSANIDEALAAFEAERMPINHEYQRTSRQVSTKIGRGSQT